MTAERTQSYGRVIKTLDDIGPAKLQPAEQEQIREAADTLIFAADVEEAHVAMAEMDALVEHLIRTERWTLERGEQLLRDLLGCGPLTPVG